MTLEIGHVYRQTYADGEVEHFLITSIEEAAGPLSAKATIYSIERGTFAVIRRYVYSLKRMT